MTSLPLFRRDLTAQGLARRTFRLRMVFATLLFIVFVFFFLGRTMVWGFAMTPISILGIGADAFRTIVVTLFAVIALFLPAIMADVFPAERRSGGLALLWITGLTPTSILLEKYLGRLVLLMTLVLVSLPLLALAYALGGVATGRVWEAFYALVLFCLQLGAIGILFSAACRTAARALICTYVAAGVIYFLALLKGGPVAWLFPPAIYLEASFQWPSAPGTPVDLVVTGVPALLSTVVFLLLGGAALRNNPPDAATTHRGPVSHDPRRAWSLRRYGRPAAISGVPEEQPVAWRERGRMRIRFQTVLIGLALALLLGTAITYRLTPQDAALETLAIPVVILVSIAWVLGAIMVVFQGAGTVTTERTDQTLEVLLTTPLTGREIVAQKCEGVHRLILAIGSVLAPLYLIRAVLHLALYAPARGGTPWNISGDVIFWQAFAALLCPAVLLPGFAYLSIWVGMKKRSRMRAVVLSLLLIFLWCALPALLSMVIAAGGGFEGAQTMFLISPLALAGAASFAPPYGELVVSMFVALALNGLALVFLRVACLSQADRRLGRVEPPAYGPTAPAAPTAP